MIWVNSRSVDRSQRDWRLDGANVLPKAAEMEAIAAAWRPWRSVGSWYLWRTLDGPAGI